jgi:hypothetical protein
MSRFTYLSILGLAFFVTAGPTQAAPTSKAPTSVKGFDLVRLVKWVGIATDLAEIISDLRKENRPAKVIFPKDPALEKFSLVATFRVPGVEATKKAIGLADDIGFFQSVKDSREIKVMVRVDVLMDVSMDLAQFQVTRASEFPDTVHISLPTFTVKAEIADDPEPYKPVWYGKLRSEWKDGGTASTLIEQAMQEAKTAAMSRFNTQMIEYRKEVAKELQHMFRKQYPEVRIYVRP